MYPFPGYISLAVGLASPQRCPRLRLIPQQQRPAGRKRAAPAILSRGARTVGPLGGAGGRWRGVRG